MAQKITKLSKLVHPEAFVQVNLVKGYKYIDKAGEIVNNYYGDVAPEFSMGLNGLVIKQPLESVEELKVAPEMVWAKFVKPGSLDLVMDTYAKEVKKILDIVEVTTVNRIGWRNYFVYEFSQGEKNEEYFANLATLNNSDAKLSQALFNLRISEDLEAKIAIKAVVKADSSNTEAILFDIDVYHEGEEAANKVGRILKSIADYLRTDFVEFFNSTFPGE